MSTMFDRASRFLVLMAALGGAALPQQSPTGKRRIAPEGWVKPPGYSHAVVTSGRPLVYVAGQVSQNEKGEFVGKGDFSAQVTQAFKNLDTVLRAAGAGWSDVVKLNYYVVGLNGERLQTIRAERNRHLPAAELPASTLVGVQALFSPEAMIEIEAVAEAPR